MNELFAINHVFFMNKSYRIIDEIHQQINNMPDNILISIILYNFATSTLQKGWITRITTHKNEAI